MNIMSEQNGDEYIEYEHEEQKLNSTTPRSIKRDVNWVYFALRNEGKNHQCRISRNMSEVIDKYKDESKYLRW